MKEMMSRRRSQSVVTLYSLLIGANLLAWTWALVQFQDHPVLLGAALLAYGLGLRHAVDADHIAAIDNVTRKHVQEGKRPLLIGFYFALGHSSVVALAVAGIAATATLLAARLEAFRSIGSVVGTSVSGGFLLAIALINLVILTSLWRAYRMVRRGGTYVEEDFDFLLNSRGLLARLFRPLFHLITRSWHMFPLGFLFGLGFDTATEVSLLGIAASETVRGLSIWTIMVFPALFAAGMTLVDTTDGILMLGAYDWAFINPLRKIYYNLVITGLSAVVALLIGGIEVLGLIGDCFGWDGWFWFGIQAASSHLNELGFLLVGLFITAWVASAAFYRYAGLGDLGAGGKHR